MPYDLPDWADYPATTSPINAANLALLNTAIQDLDTRLGDPLRLGAAFSYDPGYTDSSARAMNAANEIIYRRCVGAGTFSSVRFRVATQSGNVCVGVYANTVVSGVNQPGSLVATTGSVACPATGLSTTTALDASVTVTHGSHWFAFEADNTTATFLMAPTFPITDATGGGLIYVQTSTFPLPSSASSLTAVLRRIPLIRGV